jgi:hypothetical protein
MINVVLAAGYATRLGELTKNFPKPLLKIGNSTILGRMLDDIDNIDDITEHVIVTNHRFTPIFEEWVKTPSGSPCLGGRLVGVGGRYKKPITIIDDGSTANDNRLGAVRDLLLVMEKTPSSSPCLGGERPPQSPCLGGEKKSSLRREDLGGSEESALNREDLGGSLPFEIGIFFSGLTRSLVNSDYNLRVYECKTAAWNMLAYTDQPLKTFDKTFLRDIPKATFEKTRIAMPARFARRAEHFYSEYRRVRQGVTAWETGNMKLFGKLSFDSCESSIHNYECGSPELIAIYEIMRSLPGVYGGRFSGAGFKGACIALVDPAYKEDIQKVLTEKYLEQFPEYEKTFQVFWVRPDDGARFV